MPESDDFEMREEEQRLSRELAEWLPKQGDKLIHETPSAARVDTLGYSDPHSCQARSLVGRRGLYSDGYLQAGDRLVDGLTASPSEDELIYPILCLYRHHLELELKGCISYWLNWLSGLNANEVKAFVVNEKLNNTHSLRSLWSTLKKHYPNCDKEIASTTREAFESLLFELDNHDPNAQAARYPVDREGNQTLSRLHSVDLQALKLAVHKMSHYLGCIPAAIGQEIDWRAEIASW